MSSPAPDPSAPVCAMCQTKNTRKTIREAQRRVTGTEVGPGILWDADGRKHQHFSSPGGFASYVCECGYRWDAAFKATYYPCWCSWGSSP